MQRNFRFVAHLIEQLRGACGYSRSADGAFKPVESEATSRTEKTETLHIARLCSHSLRVPHDVGAVNDE